MDKTFRLKDSAAHARVPFASPNVSLIANDEDGGPLREGRGREGEGGRERLTDGPLNGNALNRRTDRLAE